MPYEVLEYMQLGDIMEIFSQLGIPYDEMDELAWMSDVDNALLVLENALAMQGIEISKYIDMYNKAAEWYQNHKDQILMYLIIVGIGAGALATVWFVYYPDLSISEYWAKLNEAYTFLKPIVENVSAAY